MASRVFKKLCFVSSDYSGECKAMEQCFSIYVFMTNFDYTDFLYDRSTMDLSYDEVDFYGSFYMSVVSAVSAAVASISLYIDDSIHQRPTNEGGSATSLRAWRLAQARAKAEKAAEGLDGVPEGWYNVNRMFLPAYDNGLNYQDGLPSDAFGDDTSNQNDIPNFGYSVDDNGIQNGTYTADLPYYKYTDGKPNEAYLNEQKHMRYGDNMPNYGYSYGNPNNLGYQERFVSASPPPGYDGYGWNGSYSETSPPPYFNSEQDGGNFGEYCVNSGDASSNQWSENSKGLEGTEGFQWNTQASDFEISAGGGQGSMVWNGRHWTPLMFPPGSLLGEEDIVEEMEEELENFGNELYYGTGGGEVNRDNGSGRKNINT